MKIGNVNVGEMVTNVPPTVEALNKKEKGGVGGDKKKSIVLMGSSANAIYIMRLSAPSSVEMVKVIRNEAFCVFAI